MVGRYVPTKVIRVHNKNTPLFDDQCRRALGLKKEAHLRWTSDRSFVNWEKFFRCQVRAYVTYSEALQAPDYREKQDGLMHAKPP